MESGAKAAAAAPVTSWVSPRLSDGLGNRLFQYAAAAGLAEKLKREVVFCMPVCFKASHGPIGTLFRMFPSVRVIEDAGPLISIQEPPNSHFDYQPLEELAGAAASANINIIVHGYRQSPLYFPSKPITVDWDTALGGAAVRRALEQELGLETPESRHKSYALHVRLGDYRKLPHHQVPLEKYYAIALGRIPTYSGSVLYLFSDEPELCAGTFSAWAQKASVELRVAPVRADIESLYQMSLCLGGTITANSTFSWWAAWFAHQAGAAWATYPYRWGQGLPTPVDLFPEWGVVITAV